MASLAKDVRDTIVSDDSERLILVDENDRPRGFASKAACHDGDGLLHRAFSLFVLDSRGQVLMQQRSRSKLLWPMHWSNSCCSHPREGESMELATRRRLQEELGIRCDVAYLFKFQYQEKFRDIGSEFEICHVYIGQSDDPVRFNRNEIASSCFIKPATLDRLVSRNPGWFTPWFREEWRRLRSDFREEFEALTGHPGFTDAQAARYSR